MRIDARLVPLCRKLDLFTDAVVAIAEHPFGTLKAWIELTHFLTRALKRVSTEISLHVLAYTMKRAIAILGAGPLMEAIQT